MKKFYILLLFLSSVTATLQAQVWAPNIGSYWYYDSHGAFCYGYAKYDYYKDSLINGNNCQMIRRYGKMSCPGGNHASYDKPIFTYTNSNQVVYVNDYTSAASVQGQVFDTLFWFNAPIGAKWQMIHQSYHCTGTVSCIVTVENTGQRIIQGQNLKWQKVNYMAQGGGPAQLVTDTIYERFGYLKTDPFNPNNFCSLTSDIQSTNLFRCYGDNQITDLKYKYTGACDYFVDVSVNERNASHNDLHVFPNPATSVLQISSKTELWNDAQIEIQDARGRTVLKQPFATSIDISSLAQGLYVVTVKNDMGRRSFKIMKE